MMCQRAVLELLEIAGRTDLDSEAQCTLRGAAELVGQQGRAIREGARHYEAVLNALDALGEDLVRTESELDRALVENSNLRQRITWSGRAKLQRAQPGRKFPARRAFHNPDRNQGWEDVMGMMSNSDDRAGAFTVRPRLAPAVIRLLERDGMAPDGLIAAIEAGSPIDLMSPRSSEAAAHDGEAPTVGGYLRALVRDVYQLGRHSTWDEFVALGALAADLEAAATEPAHA